MSLLARNILIPIGAFAAFFLVALLAWWAMLFAPFTLMLAVLVLLYMRVSKLSAAAGLLGVGCAASVWIQPAPLPMAYAILLLGPGVVCAAETLRRGMRLSECVFLTAASIMAGVVGMLALMFAVKGGADGAMEALADGIFRMLALISPAYEEIIVDSVSDVYRFYGIEHTPAFEECVSLLVDGFKTMLPQTVLSYSAVGALTAVTVPRAVIMRRGWKEGCAPFTPIRKWVIPRNVLFGTGVLYLIGLLSYLFVSGTSTLMLYNASVQLLVAVYGLMGAMVLDRWLFKRNWSPMARMLVLLTLYLTMRFPLCFILLADAVMTMINRRNSMRKEEDNP